jgi:signal transduction histidine kinase
MTGGDFWPLWVWYGLAIPFGLNAALFGAAHVKRGRWRKFAYHAAVSGWITATLIVTWAMAGSDAFWPVIPVVCLAMILALHAVLAAMWGGEQELVERVDELTRTRRGALDVQAHELRRIERDLHDGAQARLVALTMQLGRAEARLESNPEAAELVREARGEAKEAIAELRDLARGIAPPVLADRGLPAAVEAVAARSAIRATVDGADRLRLEITDDGRGGADPAGSGLTGLRHRVEALDGTLTVHSGDGHGTVVRAELPYGG